MREESHYRSESAGDSSTVEKSALGRLSRLCLKELREILRDRRTMFTLLLMPLLVYPLLALVFQKFLLASLMIDGPTEYFVGVSDKATCFRTGTLLEQGERVLRSVTRSDAASESPPDAIQLDQLQWVIISADTAVEQLDVGSVNLVIVPSGRSGNQGAGATGRKLQQTLMYRPGSPSSEAVLEFVETRLRAVNDEYLREKL